MKSKDNLSYGKMINSIVKNGFDEPINNMNIFDKTQVDIENIEVDNGMSMDSFLYVLLESTRNTQ